VQKQLQGSEADLNIHSPLNVEHDGKTGHPLMELTGSQAPISRTPTGLTEFDSSHHNGEFQMNDESHAPLNYKPFHGWQSNDAPNSRRVVTQDKGEGR
jgi:hypothetical protein